MPVLEYLLRGSHEETGRLMSAHAEGELRCLARWRVARHLAACELCRAAYRSLVATLETLRVLGRAAPTPRPELAQLVVERIRRGNSR